MGKAMAGDAIDQAVSPIDLKVLPDIVELLPGIPHDLAGQFDIREFAGDRETGAQTVTVHAWICRWPRSYGHWIGNG
jgi:hypothetical protein